MTREAVGAPCFGCGDTGPRARRKLAGRFCDRCSPVYRAIGREAKRTFSRAQRAGLIPDVTWRACVDCGAPARHNDHRDYLQPLVVEPTCHRCNLLRGPGIRRGDIFHFSVSAS